MNQAVNMRAIRMPEIQNRTGLSKTHIYRLIKLGQFPKPFKLSERAIAFLESDIDLWLEGRRSGRVI
jgi:prophage regulatory protein